jgi:hypothetical protein
VADSFNSIEWILEALMDRPIAGKLMLSIPLNGFGLLGLIILAVLVLVIFQFH